MRKTKFWLVQILMVAIVSLVFGSPVFAGPPDHATKSAGADKSRTALTNHAGSHSQGMLHANKENAAFMGVSEPDPVPDPEPDPVTCSAGDTSGCDSQSCFDANGFWFDIGDGLQCYF